MYQALMAMVQRALASAGPGVLQRASSLLSKHIGQPIAATASSIMGAIRNYAANNPQKVMVLTTVLANAGVDVATEELKTLASHSPMMTQLANEIGDAVARFREERANLSGDRNPSTVHGIPQADVDRNVAILRATNDIIERAARAVGGVAVLENIRAAVYLEEADFQNYKALKG